MSISKLSALIAIAAATSAAGPAGAITLTERPDVTSTVMDVRYVCDDNRNCWDTDQPPEGLSIQIGPGGVRVGSPEKPRHHYRRDRDHYSRHVEWCLDRYRSYNPRTDTYVTYGGRHKHCISPYS